MTVHVQLATLHISHCTIQRGRVPADCACENGEARKGQIIIPKPETKTIAPSGIAPKTGMSSPPTIPGP